MVIIYLSKEKFSCPKTQIMHKEIHFNSHFCAETLYFNIFENSMKQDIYSIINHVDPDQLASDHRDIFVLWAEIRPHSQLILGDFSSILKKNPNLKKRH